MHTPLASVCGLLVKIMLVSSGLDQRTTCTLPSKWREGYKWRLEVCILHSPFIAYHPVSPPPPSLVNPHHSLNLPVHCAISSTTPLISPVYSLPRSPSPPLCSIPSLEYPPLVLLHIPPRFAVDLPSLDSDSPLFHNIAKLPLNATWDWLYVLPSKWLAGCIWRWLVYFT